MKANRAFAYSVFFSVDVGSDVQEEVFANVHDAESFATLHNYATVFDNISGDIVSAWQSGRAV